jgi:uncharacterized protein
VFAVVFASLLRGFTGFGFALAAVPLASLVLPPRPVVTAALLMQTAIGLRDCVVERRIADEGAVLRLSLGAIGGTPIGLWALTALPSPAVRLALGTLVALAVAVTWRPLATRRAPASGWAFGTGFCSGICNGLAAMAGPPAILYFLAFEPNRVAMRSSLMVFFPLASLLAIVIAASVGLVDRTALLLAAIGFPIMWIGGRVGTRMFVRAGHRSYRIVAAVALVATALASIAKGFSEL